MNAIVRRVAPVFCSIVLATPVFSQHEKTGTVAVENKGDTSFSYGRLKQLPPGYEKETLEALAHFPELRGVRITFKIKKSFSTLKTRPSLLSLLMPVGHRSYIITISNRTIEKLMPLMFEHLPYDARVGVIGHELSHVVVFSRSSSWQCFKALAGHLSAHYLDRFEYHTDMICIQHGLGKNLEAWSSYIRNTMHTTFWRGAGYVNKNNPGYERYMNPSTIEKNISRLSNGQDDKAHNN
jgi:hypothetical protein